MDDPRTTWRFQIHLSTAVILMFVAGGIIWANCIEHSFYDKGLALEDPRVGGTAQNCSFNEFLNSPQFKTYRYWQGTEHNDFGWPIYARHFEGPVRWHDNRIFRVENEWTYPNGTTRTVSRTGSWLTKGIDGNTLAAAGILFCVWFICECWKPWVTTKRDEHSI
jgi:hypothetical protein